MGSRKGLVYAVIERLDSLMAVGESRRAAKLEIRARDGATWTVSDGKIHSYITRDNYQQHVIDFAKWSREHHGTKQLEQLEARAGELAPEYLRERLAAIKSPYTLQKERAALRLFFNQRDLANDVPIPKREREKITRSRRPAARDRHFQPANWPNHITFARAFGLRRSEMRDIRVSEIYERHDGHLVAFVRNGKGGLEREVPCLTSQEPLVRQFLTGRSPDEKVFQRMPTFMDVHSYRREFAQAYYQQLSGRELPPAAGRLRAGSYDRDAALEVSRALGHRRLDVVLRHYLR
jgi:integrase